MRRTLLIRTIIRKVVTGMEQKQTSIFAHRGDALHYPENTLAAFKSAIAAGTDGLELDIQLTKDRVPVIIHDERIDRTTDGEGWVRDFTYDEIRKFDAGSWFDQAFSKERIPTLEDVFGLMKNNKVEVNVELKTGIVQYEGIEEELLTLVAEWGYEDRVIVSSFNHYSLAKVREMNPSIETAALCMEALFEPWSYIKTFGATSIHCFFPVAVPEMIEGAHQHGTPLRAFTVNEDHHLKNLISQRIHGVITDDPVKAIQIRNRLYEPGNH